MKWIYFDEQKPEHGQDILVLIKNAYFPFNLVEHQYDSEREMLDHPNAEAWIPAPEKRIDWVRCRPSTSLFKSPGGKADCRFKRSITSDWVYGQVGAISLDGLSFLCGTIGGDRSWVNVCEVVACP